MFRFETEQQVCQVGSVTFGGQPGEYPTVIIPSIFQKGDQIFEGGDVAGIEDLVAVHVDGTGAGIALIELLQHLLRAHHHASTTAIGMGVQPAFMMRRSENPQRL